MPTKINPKQIEQGGATQGQYLMWDNSTGAFIPNTVVIPPATGGTASTTTFVSTSAAPTSSNVQTAIQELSDFLFCIKLS